MIKVLISILLMVSSLETMAVEFQVKGREGETLFSGESKIEKSSNVGEITVGILTKNEIPFDGSELGIREMFELTNELDIISKKEMKAWGWCFSINGEVPETLTHETPVEKNESKIVWFFAYAHYLEGEWISQCQVDYQ